MSKRIRTKASLKFKLVKLCDNDFLLIDVNEKDGDKKIRGRFSNLDLARAFCDSKGLEFETDELPEPYRILFAQLTNPTARPKFCHDDAVLYCDKIKSITRSGTTATATVTAGHMFVEGETVTISGATQTEYNGSFAISGVTRTTFQFTVTGTPATPATGTPMVRNAAMDAAWERSSSSQRPGIAEIVHTPKQPRREPRITPFALAHIATQLSIFHKDQPPESYLPKAHELLRESAAFLEGIEKDLRVVSFDELLAKASDGKTPASGIATRKGLLKAIRREFPIAPAEIIIAQEGMTQREADLLLERLRKTRSVNARTFRTIPKSKNS